MARKYDQNIKLLLIGDSGMCSPTESVLCCFAVLCLPSVCLPRCLATCHRPRMVRTLLIVV